MPVLCDHGIFFRLKRWSFDLHRWPFANSASYFRINWLWFINIVVGVGWSLRHVVRVPFGLYTIDSLISRISTGWLLWIGHGTTSIRCPRMIKRVSDHQIIFPFFPWWCDFLFAIDHALVIRRRCCVILSLLLQYHLALSKLKVTTLFVARCILMFHRFLISFDSLILLSGTLRSVFNLP